MAKVLKEYRVKLSVAKPGSQACSQTYPNNLGLRTKLGGKPEWIQGYEDDEGPNCPLCKREMSFIAQIDSIEHNSKLNPHRVDNLHKQEYMFGDVGMIYVFFCFDCCETKSVFLCY